MRFFWFLILVAFLGVVGLFAYQNHEPVGLQFLDRGLSAPLSLVIGVVYVLGMMTGWAVVGVLKRSLKHVTEPRARTQ